MTDQHENWEEEAATHRLLLIRRRLGEMVDSGQVDAEELCRLAMRPTDRDRRALLEQSKPWFIAGPDSKSACERFRDFSGLCLVLYVPGFALGSAPLLWGGLVVFACCMVLAAKAAGWKRMTLEEARAKLDEIETARAATLTGS